MSTQFSYFKDYTGIIQDLIEKSRSQELLSNKICKRIKIALKTRKNLIFDLLTLCKEYSQSDVTILTTIEIFDTIIKFFEFDLSSRDMYIIMIASLFISSKFEEVNQIKLFSLIDLHTEYIITKEDILGAERIILNKLKYKIPHITKSICNSLQLEEENIQGENENIILFFIFLFKLSMVSYDFTAQKENLLYQLKIYAIDNVRGLLNSP